MLWRVSRYSGPGFPSPTTTWANASPPAYFSFSAFFGASGFFAAAATGAFLPSASAGAPSSLGLRSVRTSGSAGVTAAATSGVGATSSAIGGDTVATAWPGSLTIRTPSGGRRSRTVRTSPMARFETSASMRSGMLVGSVETSTSCMTRLRMPFVSRTPTASPTGCTATRTVMARSARTSWMSTCTSFSVTGSNCMSRMMAIRAPPSPSTFSESSCVVPSWPWMMRSTSRGLTVMVCGVAPPYRMAGTAPARRRRRATPLPVPSRRLTVISGVFIAQAPWCSCLHEQGRDGFLVVDPPNGLAEQRRHRQHGHPTGHALLGRERDRVGDDDLLDGRGLDAVDGRAPPHGVAAARQDAPRALPLDGGDRLHQRAGGFDHVVDHHRVAAVDVADEVHGHGRPRLVAPLVDDGQARVEPLGDRARTLHAAGVGRDEDGVAEVLLLQIVDHHDRAREQVVDRDVEEALDLARVQVQREHAIHPGRLEQVGDELGRDRHARLHLAVLARVAVVGQHGRDAMGRRALERVDHDQQLHQRVVHGRAGGLDDEDIRAADVLVDLHVDLAVGEAGDLRVRDRHAKILRDLLRQRAVCVAGEQLQVVGHRRLALRVVGAGGFEPPNTGSKVPRLATWPRPKNVFTARLAGGTGSARTPKAISPLASPEAPARLARPKPFHRSPRRRHRLGSHAQSHFTARLAGGTGSARTTQPPLESPVRSESGRPSSPRSRGSAAGGSAARARTSARRRTPLARCPTSARRARPPPAAPPASVRSAGARPPPPPAAHCRGSRPRGLRFVRRGRRRASSRDGRPCTSRA